MAPGQIAMFDPALLTRATRRYPEATRRYPTATGTVLSVLDGGAPTPIAPVVVVARRRAA
jgi:hypothetical protein